MTYKEQLLSKEWLLKRNEILKNQKNVCQNCLNKSYAKFNQGIIFESPTGNEVRKYWIKIWDLKNNQIINSQIIDTRFNPAENYVCFFQKLNNYFNIVALKKISKDVIEFNPVIEIVKQGIKGKVSEKTYNEVYKQTDINDVWIFNLGLHIHHKYYQNGLMAWEYPNEALQTLCWQCHETIHSKSKIPVLNKDGLEIDKFNYCKRCHGAGIFPEFSHIQAGICFECNGARYKELIVNT